jgi:hypothetical protein
MSMATMEPHGLRIDWRCVQKAFRYALGFGFAFALGGWVVSIRVQEASLAYKNQATHQLEAIHKAVGPNPVAEINCERKKSAVAIGVAAKLAVIAKADDPAVPIPSLAAIPHCHGPVH